jgi:phytoene dehydrogenase-like protein
MANDFDAVVVGGGHNGLVAAAYLAKHGARVVLLEAREKTGGAADTSAPFPGHPEIRVTTLSYVMSLMPPTIIRDLRLKELGYEVYPYDGVYAPQPGGGGIRSRDGIEGSRHEAYARYSERDAEALESYERWLQRSADMLGPMLMQIPPKVGSLEIGDLVDQLRFALRLRKGMTSRQAADLTKLFTMSAADLLDGWFESDAVKGLMCCDGIIGTWAGPEEPGTAYVLMHHCVGDVGDGQLSSWGFPRGGMGAVAEILQRSAESFGAQIRCDTPVERLIIRGGRVRGAVTRDGEEFLADTVVTCVHPKIGFLKHIERSQLPAEFVRDIENWRTRSGTVKVNVALERMPAWRDDPDGVDPDIAGASIQIAPGVRYLERAFEEARDGKASTAPFSESAIPSYFDRTLAPEGTHVMSMFSQWVPHTWADEPDQAELEAYADRLIDAHEEFMPGLKDAMIGRQVLGPHELQEGWGLIGGNIFHGELTPDQLFHMRPAPGYADYRTPIRGLYQASSATHAGGGVTGIPGYHVVRQIRKDRSFKNNPDP